jgi:hypothetical protein
MITRVQQRLARLLTLGITLGVGCSGTGQELDLASYSSSVDQRLIADYYRQEADRFRQQADELEARMEMYERLFGSGSDWVAGTRLLADSYRHAADERERLAREHVEALRHP